MAIRIKKKEKVIKKLGTIYDNEILKVNRSNWYRNIGIKECWVISNQVI